MNYDHEAMLPAPGIDNVPADECGECGEVHEALVCLDGPYDCTGAVEYREPLSATGKSFARCDGHWEIRLDYQRDLEERYPVHAPSDFDPAYAGEHWDEDY